MILVVYITPNLISIFRIYAVPESTDFEGLMLNRLDYDRPHFQDYSKLHTPMNTGNILSDTIDVNDITPQLSNAFIHYFKIPAKHLKNKIDQRYTIYRDQINRNLMDNDIHRVPDYTMVQSQYGKENDQHGLTYNNGLLNDGDPEQYDLIFNDRGLANDGIVIGDSGLTNGDSVIDGIVIDDNEFTKDDNVIDDNGLPNYDITIDDNISTNDVIAIAGSRPTKDVMASDDNGSTNDSTAIDDIGLTNNDILSTENQLTGTEGTKADNGVPTYINMNNTDELKDTFNLPLIFGGRLTTVKNRLFSRQRRSRGSITNINRRIYNNVGSIKRLLDVLKWAPVQRRSILDPLASHLIG